MEACGGCDKGNMVYICSNSQRLSDNECNVKSLCSTHCTRDTSWTDHVIARCLHINHQSNSSGVNPGLLSVTAELPPHCSTPATYILKQ